MTRIAQCCCGQLRITCEGEPLRHAICHCVECQRRTGSVFSAQVRFRREQTRSSGEARAFSRLGDSGGQVTFQFCPVCGSTVYWTPASQPDVVLVALGAFADPGFGTPQFSVFEASRHSWVEIVCAVERRERG